MASFPRVRSGFPRLASEHGIFSHLAVLTDTGVNLRVGDRTDRVAALLTTSDLFGATGIPPLRGRAFNEADCKPGAEPVVVIREELWQTQFAGREDIVGLSAVIDGKTRTVAGVMPKNFPRLQLEMMYVPIVLAPPLTTERGSRSYGNDREAGAGRDDGGSAEAHQ